MGALNSDMLCAGAPAGESPLVPDPLTATETDAAMPTNLRGNNLVMQQLPRRLGPFPPISTGENVFIYRVGTSPK